MIHVVCKVPGQREYQFQHMHETVPLFLHDRVKTATHSLPKRGNDLDAKYHRTSELNDSQKYHILPFSL